MSASNYAELAILDALVGTTTFTAVANVYLQLHTADPGEDGTASVATENTRQIATWNAAAAGAVALAATVSWASVAATETYTHWSLWDASTAGNCHATGTINSGTGVAVTLGDNFDLTALSITCD